MNRIIPVQPGFGPSNHLLMLNQDGRVYVQSVDGTICDVEADRAQKRILLDIMVDGVPYRIRSRRYTRLDALMTSPWRQLKIGSSIRLVSRRFVKGNKLFCLIVIEVKA